MLNKASFKVGLTGLFVIALSAWMVGGLASCGTAPTPFIVRGPGDQFGNVPPTLEFVEPLANLTVSQGDPFLIRWEDDDRDNNATISFNLIDTTSNEVVSLVSGIPENDTIGQDRFRVSTSLIAPSTYNLLGIIDDGVNAAVEVFATVAGAANVERLTVTIVPPGVIPPTIPPIVAVTEPAFNLSVAQDDLLSIVVRPTDNVLDNTTPFDPDSTAQLFVVLDFDLDPKNDDPANPDPSKIIVIHETEIGENTADTQDIEITVDLNAIPARESGEPYFIRATLTDLLNPPVHSYAPGNISVVRLAAGIVDLFEIGRTKSGARFQGFNPRASLGSSLAGVSDFDADTIDDFVLVAQFGNPQNVGPVGEAYLVYGQNNVRFGGTISVNSVSSSVSGVIFQGPPLRSRLIEDPNAYTSGITDVDFMPDVTGDGRPELIFGLAHVHGAYNSMDFDPSDADEDADGGFGCYPDSLVNNRANVDDLDIGGWFAGGMAVVVNSTNRDNDGLINVTRLESTAVPLEFVGQLGFDDGFLIALDAEGIVDPENPTSTANIVVRADNSFAEVADDDPVEENRQAGARFTAGGFDFWDAFLLGQPPRNGLFGQTVASIGDLDADNIPEFVISAPNNQVYFAELQRDFGTRATQVESTIWANNVVIIPGSNYNNAVWRGRGDGRTSTFPSYASDDPGICAATNPRPRRLDFPPEAMQIVQEEIDDALGDGQSAGDFNRDGLDDILCGAPRNDRNESNVDTGATYIIYGRNVFGDVQLANADDPTLRPPMLRIRGLRPNDQIGWAQTAGLDVNGDRVDDVFIGSPKADFGGVSRSTCGDDFNGDGIFNQNDLALLSFNNCVANFGAEVFTDDACKVYDYDNDRDIDEDDRCVFCCLSNECSPDDSCILGRGAACCENVADNGFVGIVFGGVFLDGDRDLNQLATSQLPGVKFYGGKAGDNAGYDISSAGDFNLDGFGDILITAPGRIVKDEAGRDRLGVVYLVFGGTHLINTSWSLDEVGTEQLPGMTLFSPYVASRPNEAPPLTVGFIGDVNNDGFGDIAIGSPRADFIDPTFPQGPDAPGSDPATGRRSDVGDAYIVYGNNFGSNRASVP